MVSRAEQRASFSKDRAPSLAEGVCPAATPWSTALALSKYFAWFADDDHLVVVGCPGERQADLDLGLAYGLGHVGDRELVIVVPEGSTEPTRRRMPWIDVPIRLYAYGLDDAVEEVMPLSRSQVFATYRDKVVTELHSITEPQSQWVEELIGWASSQQFDVAHRPSYLAWHVQGRMVLRIKKTADGLLVTAGGPTVPPALLDQLADGGRLVMPVGREWREQELLRVRRDGDRLVEEDLGPVRFVPLVGEQGWPDGDRSSTYPLAL